jgi:MoaA/NifB/PqqE/SkfB family radical SAM enzyme
MIKIPKIAHLVLKPTLACTARCETCSTRRALHKVKIRGHQLNISHWKKLFWELNELGLNKLTLSGGEPTLYKDLIELIKEGKKYGWEIGLNTNGSLIDEELASRLHAAGLNWISLSIYSATRGFHDRIRNHTGLWQKALSAATCFANIKERLDPCFRVCMQTIICKENYHQFPELVRLAYRMKFCSITFSYLEADYKERKYLLDERQITEFRSEVIPRVVDIISKSAAEKLVKRIATSAVKSIYRSGDISINDYALGIYRSFGPCEIPSFFAIILANGDVHPCNIVEYTHYPVVGNLRKRSFREIWGGDEWANFRKEGFDLCRYCPVPQQVVIPITRRPDCAWIQHLIKTTALRKFHTSLKRMVYSNRRLLKIIRQNK